MADPKPGGETAQSTEPRRRKLNDVMTLGDARMIAKFFQALSDPTRVRMIRALADKEWCVSDLTEALGMDQPAVSHQLKYLREMGLVQWTKTGRHVYYSLANPHMLQVLMSSIAHLGEDPAPTVMPPSRQAKV